MYPCYYLTYRRRSKESCTTCQVEILANVEKNSFLNFHQHHSCAPNYNNVYSYYRHWMTEVWS